MARPRKPAPMSNPAPLSKFEKIISNGAEWTMAAQDLVVLQ